MFKLIFYTYSYITTPQFNIVFKENSKIEICVKNLN